MKPKFSLFVLLLLLSFIWPPITRGATASLPDSGAFRTGVYIPLEITSDGPGKIHLRAPLSLGIDWPATARTTVVVPWMTWQESAGEITFAVNDQSKKFFLQPVDNLPEHAGFPFALAAAPGPTTAAPSADVYLPTLDWNPGVPADERRWVVAAAVLLVLLLAAVRLLLTHSLWVIAGAVLVGLGAAVLLPVVRPPVTHSRAIMTVLVPPNRVDVWVYQTAGSEQRVMEPFLPTAGWSGNISAEPSQIVTTIVPNSADALNRLDPVLNVNSVGWPVAITANVASKRPAAFLHQFTFEPMSNEQLEQAANAAEDLIKAGSSGLNDDPAGLVAGTPLYTERLISTETVRRLYGRPAVVDDGRLFLVSKE